MLKPTCVRLGRLALPLAVGLLAWHVSAQTDGAARLEVTLLDYNGSGTRHYTVVWVTTDAGAFITSLRKQGPSSWTSRQWTDHCRTWSNARGASTALDGYTSATAANYSGTNSPVICTWDCRDASDTLVPDGQYRFWVQYAEDSGQGPYTTAGLIWTKSAVPATTTYPNQGANFANMKVVWSPSTPPPVAPTITSAAPPAAGTVGVPYHFLCTATGSSPISFSAVNLPPGLEVSPAGTLSGIPTAAGSFAGTITAANGTLPNANQPLTITVEVVPASFTSVSWRAGSVIMEGKGPPNGTFSLLSSPEPGVHPGLWNPAGTGIFDAQGHVSVTNAAEANLSQTYYRLRVP